jgi:circadian clock protein KaiC
VTHDNPFERRPTGIPGLDRVLEGGLLTAGVYIVQGPPGAGKTILANHLCFNHAAAGSPAVYVTLLAETHARMIGHLRRMTFFDPAAVSHRVYYIGGFNTLESGGLGGVVTLVRGAMQKHRATLLVIDGLASAQDAAASTRDFKKFILELQTVAELGGCTTLLLTNSKRGDLFPEHTMVDGIIELTREVSRLRPIRHLHVVKLRGTAQVPGLHTIQISDAGVVVRPRIETQFPSADGGPPSELAVTMGTKVATGIAELDRMLRGGVRPGSLTMILGSSGSGKTLFGMQFLAEGLKQGEPGVYFGFYEHPDAIMAKCQRVGIGGIKDGVARGHARLVWQRPVEGIIDILGERLIDAVRSMRAKRVVIDGIQGFELAADFPERTSNVYAALAQELERLGVTTWYTSEMRELFGATISVPIAGLSAATQNILLLRHVELRARVLRLLAILKVRDGEYDPRVRELKITEEGIHLDDILPDQGRLIMGGAASPENLPGDPQIR